MARKIETGNVSPKEVGRKISSKSFKGGRLYYSDTKIVQDKKTGEVRRITDSGSFNIFGAVLLILILSALIGFLTGSPESKTFRGFLEMLQNVPDISSDLTNLWSLPIFNVAFPSWLSWLDSFVDFFGGLYVVASYIVVGLGQALLYIVYFLQWLFV